MIRSDDEADTVRTNEMEEKVFDTLGRNIPGGIIGSYLEPSLPLYYINDYMLSCLNFARDEFLEAVDGQVMNCIHPDDRARVGKLVEEAFLAGTDYEVKYRMLKKTAAISG